MTITPLVDLLVEVRNNRPDVLILLGPFVDADAEVLFFLTFRFLIFRDVVVRFQ